MAPPGAFFIDIYCYFVNVNLNKTFYMKSKPFIIFLAAFAIIAIIVLFLGFCYPKNYHAGLLTILAFAGAASVAVLVLLYLTHIESLQNQLSKK